MGQTLLKHYVLHAFMLLSLTWKESNQRSHAKGLGPFETQGFIFAPPCAALILKPASPDAKLPCYGYKMSVR